jgi:hypothetical protein
VRVGYYETAAGRSQPRDFIDALSEPYRGAIRADIHVVAEHGRDAPASMKPIKGHSPLWEIRTLDYRTFYYFEGDMLVVLHVCKKQDQKRGIKIAARRLRELREA